MDEGFTRRVGGVRYDVDDLPSASDLAEDDRESAAADARWRREAANLFVPTPCSHGRTVCDEGDCDIPF